MSTSKYKNISPSKSTESNTCLSSENETRKDRHVAIIGLLITLILGVFGASFTYFQNKIATQNNYFQTINNLQGMDNQLELLSFAYKESPEEYVSLISYYIYKEPKLLNSFVFQTLDNELKLSFIRLLLNIAESSIESIHVRNSPAFKSYTNDASYEEKVLPELFSFLSKNSLSIFTTRGLAEMDKKRIRNLVYGYFDIIIETNPQNRSHFIGSQIPLWSIAGLNFAFLDNETSNLIMLLSRVLSDEDLNESNKSLTKKIINNFVLSLMLTSSVDQADILDKIKKYFYFLTPSEMESKSYLFNEKFNLYYWLSILHLNAVPTRDETVASFIDNNVSKIDKGLFSPGLNAFKINRTASEIIYLYVSDKKYNKTIFDDLASVDFEVAFPKCLFDGETQFILGEYDDSKKDLRIIWEAIKSVQHGYGKYYRQNFKENILNNKKLQELAGMKIVDCDENAVSFFE